MEYGYMLQPPRTLKKLCTVKAASHKRAYTVWVPLHETSRRGKSMRDECQGLGGVSGFRIGNN